MSFFAGKNGLRHQFEKLSVADLVGATSITTAKLWIALTKSSRLSFIDNDLSDTNGNGIDIGIAAVHPESDPSLVSSRLFWLEVAGHRVINYSMLEPNTSIDPGTRFYVWVVSGTPTAGAIRFAAWG